MGQLISGECGGYMGLIIVCEGYMGLLIVCGGYMGLLIVCHVNVEGIWVY